MGRAILRILEKRQSLKPRQEEALLLHYINEDKRLKLQTELISIAPLVGESEDLRKAFLETLKNFQECFQYNKVRQETAQITPDMLNAQISGITDMLKKKRK